MASKRKQKHEEHLNHEAWAIPYADLITLLLAFFVVMYAISTVNAGKYRVLSNSLIAAFRGTPHTIQPIQVGKQQPSSVHSAQNAVIRRSMLEHSMLNDSPRSLVRPVRIDTHLPNSPTSHSPAHLVPQSAHAAAEARLLQRVAAKVLSALNQLVRAKLVIVHQSPTLVQVEIRTDILFPSGSAKLSRPAAPIIHRLGKILKPFPNPILVEGDTDNRPIHTVEFPSNWELSAARAASVVRRFVGAGVEPERMAVVGHAQYEPVASNATATGRNANRRVDIVILATPSGVPQAERAVRPTTQSPPTSPAIAHRSVAAPKAVKPATAAQTHSPLPAIARIGTVSAP